MSAIGFEEIAHNFSRLESRMLKTYPQLCVRLRHRKAQCTLCADNCPTRAITWSDAARFDPARCTGCGTCAAICPTGAFEAASPTNVELLQRIAAIATTTTRCAFACRQAIGKETRNVVRVNCLGRLDESILVGAAANGFARIELAEKACHNCLDKIGRQAATQAIAEANMLLQAFGRSVDISFVSQISATTAPKISSPNENIRPAVIVLNEDMLPTETRISSEETLAAHVPTKRQLLLASSCRKIQFA